MYLTGFADEAADDLAGQIRATQQLGWRHIEARSIDGCNIHDLPQERFEEVAEQLAQAGIGVNCFGSAIANWGKQITDPFDATLAEVRRAIPRMKRLGAGLVRIMSYAVLKDRLAEDQLEEMRFERLRTITQMFLDEGLQPVHENCMNYGGMGWPYTLRLVENVPGLKLVFDTGNPVFALDRSKPQPHPMQSSWEFYEHVRELVAYVHVKDAIYHAPASEDDGGGPEYTFPGEGSGDVRRILQDLITRGYDGGISIEPHMGTVFHEDNSKRSPAERMEVYVEYGHRLERMIRSLVQERPTQNLV